MHLPSANPRPSIYYNYQVFEPWLPTENGKQEKKKVVIVGAGPAGMVTALELARHGHVAYTHLTLPTNREVATWDLTSLSHNQINYILSERD